MSDAAVAQLAQQPDPVEEAQDAIEEPSYDVYHNQLEDSSRFYLGARAYAYRAGASIAFGIGNMTPPAVPPPVRTVYFDSTISKKHGGKEKIKAEVWTPDRSKSLSRKSSRGSLKATNKAQSKKHRNPYGGESTSDNEDLTGGSLRPTVSRFSSSVSVSGSGNGDRSGKSIRPSLSRLSSRMSIRSSKSKSSLSLPTTPMNPVENPMDQVPETLLPQADPRSRRPCVINFHGGGFTMGTATDDGRWAMAAMQALGAVVISVEYRLAPTYPFPTPVEDCADAILQVWRRADEFWIDRDKIMLSGFSAGGTLALASWVLLQDHKRWDYDIAPALGKSTPDGSWLPGDGTVNPGIKINGRDQPSQGGDDSSSPSPTDIPQPAGLMLFYPLLDWTVSRPRKRLTCSKPEETLPRSLTDLFDASYIYPAELKSQLDDPRLSPGLMSDSLVDRLPPVQMCLCEYDMLLAEGKQFAGRLRARGREVGFRVVSEAKHAWDKPQRPPFMAPDSLGVEYGEAVKVMAGWLGVEEGNGSGLDGFESSGSNLHDEVPAEGKIC